MSQNTKTRANESPSHPVSMTCVLGIASTSIKPGHRRSMTYDITILVWRLLCDFMRASEFAERPSLS
jgi:hypothetical protein